MPLQTNLNVSPYFDDFDETKNYYKILFQPGVAVQARELNQLQTMLQNQVERFGDNIFKKGTIVDGCNISFNPLLAYVKLKDVEFDNPDVPLNVQSYIGYSVKNLSNGLSAKVIAARQGLESSDPDLNTIYVKYTDAGSNGTMQAFSANDVLTIYDPKNRVFRYRVNNGSSGFSNSDTLAVVSAIAVKSSNTSNTKNFGSFTIANGDVIKNNGIAQAKIVSIDSTTEADSVILRIRPITENLRSGDARTWRFSNNELIEISKSNNPTIKATNNRIVNQYGQAANGSIQTDVNGKLVSVSVTDNGVGYNVLPFVTVSSNSATVAEIETANVEAQTYLSKVQVAPVTIDPPIGFGYGMTIGDGVIYQKGYFSRVSQQLLVVNRYSNTGFDKSVGFFTAESIVDSNIDPTLLDNATGTFNYTAPGADRLKLTPQLIAINTDTLTSNADFFPIVEFSDGRPYRRNSETVYNVLGREMAARTYDESGNYVLDQFFVATKDSSLVANTASKFDIYIDPGLAYIKGFKVRTYDNYTGQVDKGTATATQDSTLRLGYGEYIRVKELGGVFSFNIGDLVEFTTQPTQYISKSTTAGAAIVRPGAKIGQARMRSLVLEDGVAGTADAVYRLYLFDINFAANKNSDDVRGIFYNGPLYKGIADVVVDRSKTLVPGPGLISANTTSTLISGSGTKFFSYAPGDSLFDPNSNYVGKIKTISSDTSLILEANGLIVLATSQYKRSGMLNVYDTESSTALFKGVNAMKATSNVAYTYRTNTPVTMQANGTATVTPTVANTSFPYLGTLSTPTENDFVVVPLQNIQSAANITGLVAVANATTTTVTGTSTQFLTDLRVGDYIRIGNTISGNVTQILSINSDTNLTTVQPLGIARTANSTQGTTVVYFPNNVPIPLTTRTTRAVVANSSTLQFDIGSVQSPTSWSGTASANVVITHNARTANAAPVAKTPNRTIFARIVTSNNAGGTTGPWALGVSDVFRLRKVYLADSSQATNYTFNANTGVVSNFVTLSNHPYANGDQVVYQTATGNTALSGITNAASYFVVAANSTGLKLSSTRGGTALSLTASSVSETGHFLIGYPLYFGPDTNDVQDITNLFYADANHRDNYLDTSYLYKKPRTDSLAVNSTLLVEFDCFTTAAEGLKTIASYDLLDTANLETITATAGKVHTLEIPEFGGTSGQAYYDLRDQFDFRPRSANTIPLLANTSSTWANTLIVNPIEPLDGVTSSFNANLSVNSTSNTITITNQPYVLGDQLTYFTSTGNTVISGLANNTSYFVSFANATVIALSATSGGANVDLTASTTVEVGHFLALTKARFSASEKFFPVPDSELTSRIQYYLPRNDRVVLDEKGDFVVVKGVDGSIRSFPQEPQNAMTLNMLTIPPYPSLPAALSNTIMKIADTKTFTEAKGKRIKSFTVSLGLAQTDINQIQTRGYTMKDIQKLEQRLADLERVTAWTFLEAIARARYIPSSLDPFVERAKMAFFVEPFVDERFADLDHPEFYARISDNRLKPVVDEFNVQHIYDKNSRGDVGVTIGSMVFNEYTLVNQSYATDTQIRDVEKVSQEITITTFQNKNQAYSGDGTVYDDWYFTMSATPGPIELYFNGKDSNYKVEVYQSSTPNSTIGAPIITHLAYQQLTRQDKAVGGGAYNLGTHENDGTNGGWIEDSWKLLFRHNPDNGIYYTLRVIKGKNAGGFLGSQGRGRYQARLYYPSDVITTFSATTSSASPSAGARDGDLYIEGPGGEGYTINLANYGAADFYINTGTASAYPSVFTLTAQQESYNDIVVRRWIADAQKFEITLTGLTPYKRHYFFFDGIDSSSKCQQIIPAAQIGNFNPGFQPAPGELYSSTAGHLQFEFYYDAGITEATSDFELQNQKAASIAGRKAYNIRSDGGGSSAGGVIDIAYYGQATASQTSPAASSTGSSGTGTSPNLTTSGSTITGTYTGTNTYNYNEAANDAWKNNSTQVDVQTNSRGGGGGGNFKEPSLRNRED